MQWFFNANIPLTHVDISKLTSDGSSIFIAGVEEYGVIHNYILGYIEKVPSIARANIVLALGAAKVSREARGLAPTFNRSYQNDLYKENGYPKV